MEIGLTRPHIYSNYGKEFHSWYDDLGSPRIFVTYGNDVEQWLGAKKIHRCRNKGIKQRTSKYKTTLIAHTISPYLLLSIPHTRKIMETKIQYTQFITLLLRLLLFLATLHFELAFS